MGVMFIAGATGVAITDAYKAEVGKMVSKLVEPGRPVHLEDHSSFGTVGAEKIIIEVVKKIIDNSLKRVDNHCECKKTGGAKEKDVKVAK